jgi:transposase
MYLQKFALKEVQMLREEDFIVIKTLNKRGVYQKDIAAEIGVHPKTVSRALKRGSAPERKRGKRGSKLDPFKPKVDQLLAENVWNAKVILREIQALGYPGGYTILRDYIKPKRVLRPDRATVRFETEPGQQLQSDWGETRTMIKGVETKVHFIVNQLGYSRRFHAWCTDSQDAEHTYEGLVRSFEYFGGVPEEVLVDNQKSAVLEHSADRGVRFNPRFTDLASHYGFRPRACKPYRARTKGKSERMVHYLKANFFVRYRSFESWAHLNQMLEKWLCEETDERVHGTVKEVVRERFERERSSLQQLPTTRYDTSYFEVRKVSWDGYIDVRGNRYSVPGNLTGTTVRIRISLEGVLRVFHGETLIARHRICPAREGWVTVPGHHQDLWNDVLKVERRSLEVYEEVA